MTDSAPPPKGHVKIAATIPAAVVAAALTIAGNWYMHTNAATGAPTADDVRELRAQMQKLEVNVATLSGQLGALAEDAKNAKVVEALRQGRAP